MALGSGIRSLIWGNLLDKFSAKLVYIALSLWLGLTPLLFMKVNSELTAFSVALLFGIGLGGLLVVPPVVVANYFGTTSLGTIRGITEPFVSLGQSIGAISSGVIYDISHSYELTFPIFTFVGIIAAILLLFLISILSLFFNSLTSIFI